MILEGTADLSHGMRFLTVQEGAQYARAHIQLSGWVEASVWLHVHLSLPRLKKAKPEAYSILRGHGTPLSVMSALRSDGEKWVKDGKSYPLTKPIGYPVIGS
ncbi:hypothetical protein GCM10023212_11720 [Luteolibacter yonseiensis]